MIQLANVTKNYGSKAALKGISLTVKRGEVLGLLGPNGAGKSTTMRLIAGYMPPTSGTIKVAEYDVVKQPIAAKRVIGYLPENPPLYKDMTVKDFISYSAELKGLKGKKKSLRVDKVMEEVGVGVVKNRLISHISRGYRQRVGLAQALVGQPEVLILDEPTVGLDPQQIIEIRQLIKNLAGKSTIILSSHILPEVSSLCHRVAIINKGRLIAEDTPENLSEALKGKREIILKIKGPEKDILSALQNVSGVQSVSANPIDTDISEFRVIFEKGRDVREDLFFAMASRGFAILEMIPSKMSLEEIFLELTTEEDSIPVSFKEGDKNGNYI
ncbi:MAG: gliding motility-associated transport system ATP-binding protein [Tepidanaerobacteraceae bacterium]|nr:gliding motility-associated transport system ATP-binding protein [Tepidanaerobacteraceae bacterium]